MRCEMSNLGRKISMRIQKEGIQDANLVLSGGGRLDSSETDVIPRGQSHLISKRGR